MCKAGVDVEVYNAVGGFHDFIEYSEGCGDEGPPELEHCAARLLVLEGGRAVA